MKAIAIRPGTPHSVHLRDVPRPSLDEVADGRGVRVPMIRAGLCGTDADLAAGEYGVAPPGRRLPRAGPRVAGARRPRSGPAADVCRSGSWWSSPSAGRVAVPTTASADPTSPPIPSSSRPASAGPTASWREEVVVDAGYLVPVPDELEDVAILTEPLSCITKSLRQADQVQARLDLWEPRRALVTGAGTIGLLATLALRLRGLDVTTYARRARPDSQQRAHRAPGRALRQRRPSSTCQRSCERDGPFDIVFEGSGAPALIEPAVAALAPNGVPRSSASPPAAGRCRSTWPAQPVARALQPRARGQCRSGLGRLCGRRGHHRRGAGERGHTSGWLTELITDRIEGFDAEAIAGHLAGCRRPHQDDRRDRQRP